MLESRFSKDYRISIGKEPPMSQDSLLTLCKAVELEAKYKRMKSLYEKVASKLEGLPEGNKEIVLDFQKKSFKDLHEISVLYQKLVKEGEFVDEDTKKELMKKMLLRDGELFDIDKAFKWLNEYVDSILDYAISTALIQISN